MLYMLLSFITSNLLKQPPNLLFVYCLYFASLLFQAMGLGAFMVPAVALLGALKVLFKPALEWKIYLNGFLCLLLFLIVETALSLYPGRLAL